MVVELLSHVLSGCPKLEPLTVWKELIQQNKRKMKKEKK